MLSIFAFCLRISICSEGSSPSGEYRRTFHIDSGGGRKERSRQRGGWLFPAKFFVLLGVDQLCQSYARTPLDYRRLKRFDVLKISDEEKLIVPLKEGETNIKYYVINNEFFSVLYEIRIRTGHGGRTRMLRELQTKYKNITYEVVMLYLNLCERCQTKQSEHKKSIVVKPMISSTLNSRFQVDLIDLQSNGDDENNFIMVYQDHLTKFVQLRPLKTKRAEEVAYKVL
ncbi:KRAB-A domain-containing protein 2 [Trichonephila clavipes]|nr:KRAB-A domain-containing protein 2 [Trichonephila clavipes]